jgi:exosortase A
MRPDTIAALQSRLSVSLQLPDVWRVPLARLALAWLALGLVFRSDWAAMAAQWWNISTYNHILLIPAIIVWLVWVRLGELAKLRAEAWWPGLLLLLGALFVWVLGSFAELAIIRQAAAVAMLIAATLALLGPRIGAGLAFPLGYMLLLVPFGEELVPPLQMITAGITVALVHVSGIPATIDGVFIDTPVGLFEVAEACSGISFLVAMFAFGLLTAHVCFVSWWRRIGFMAMALAMPVLANGVRAWGTVFGAQYIGVERAAGIDHIIYGWVFFAFVLAMVLTMSWRWFDRPRDAAFIDGEAIAASRRLGGQRLAAIPLMVIGAVLTLAAIVWSNAGASLSAPLPNQIALPEVAGWHRVNYTPRAAWEPRATGADHRLLGRYADGKGHEADVFIALYAAQGPGRKPAGFGEGALRTDSSWAWQTSGPAIGWGRSDRLLGPGKVARLAYTGYRTGDLLTGSAARLALANMQDRLLLRASPTATLILSAEERPGAPAAQSLAAFQQSTGPLAAWMDRITALR